MIEFEKEIIKYLNIPSLPSKEWNGKDSFQDGVAVVSMPQKRYAYAVCTFNKETDKEPRIKKVFGIEPFTSVDKIFVVPSYMDNDTSDADLDSESKKHAEQLAAEAAELESKGTVEESIEKANKLPEWIFDEIHNREEAIAWLKQYNARNGIKKSKVPTNEETIKLRLYNIYMSNKKRGLMDWEYHKLRAQVSVMKDVEKTYPTATISCAIKQMESRINYIESQNKE